MDGFVKIPLDPPLPNYCTILPPYFTTMMYHLVKYPQNKGGKRWLGLKKATTKHLVDPNGDAMETLYYVI
jgi:hypothetical protein